MPGPVWWWRLAMVAWGALGVGLTLVGDRPTLLPIVDTLRPWLWVGSAAAGFALGDRLVVRRVVLVIAVMLLIERGASLLAQTSGRAWFSVLVWAAVFLMLVLAFRIARGVQR